MKIISTLKCTEYGQVGHPESPLRIKNTYKFLKDKGYKIIEPKYATEDDILLVHSKNLLEKVKSEKFFDPDTPVFKGIFDFARLAVGAAIKSAEFSMDNDFAFSLMRPPGHHATRDDLGGFCYFNNIAIAIKKVLAKVKRAAILDIDVHHGNGTEQIFRGKENVLYISLHQSSLYPGTGLSSEKNCLNFPLPAGTGERRYLAILKQALEQIRQFRPNIIGISCGFDTFNNDPIANLQLDVESYYKIAQFISDLNIPFFCVLEGGYSQSLPRCIESFLEGGKHV
jgi:acetoin utilization deacetylase AcuC-like enzyme